MAWYVTITNTIDLAPQLLSKDTTVWQPWAQAALQILSKRDHEVAFYNATNQFTMMPEALHRHLPHRLFGASDELHHLVNYVRCTATQVKPQGKE